MNASQQQTLHIPHRPEIADFALLHLIGAGSYGDVWLARGVTGAFRAIKFVYRDRFESDNAFEREFRGIQAFEPISRTHPNLVQILHVGRNSTAGFYFYVMELADDASGDPLTEPTVYSPRTLRSVLRSDRLELPQAVSIMQQLAAGLAYLHGQTLVHRDIKPSNIVFVAGIPKLGDIGLVSPPRKDMTFVGTEGYIPPEGMGRAPADVYSLGKVCYELATWKDRMDFPELASAPPATRGGQTFKRLNGVILKACDPNPRRRFASADALTHALRSVSADAVGGATTHIDGARSRRLWATAVAATCVLLVVIWVFNRTKHNAVNAVQNMEHPTSASAQHAVPVLDANDGAPRDMKITPLSNAGTGSPPPETVNADSKDAAVTPIPTKTVTTEGAGEFLNR